eukprot:symbB.v1.2.018241.t1/scaffold1447.1/size118252/1
MADSNADVKPRVSPRLRGCSECEELRAKLKRAVIVIEALKLDVSVTSGDTCSTISQSAHECSMCTMSLCLHAVYNLLQNLWVFYGSSRCVPLPRWFGNH